jgi:DNA-binding NtrC family response regulator
MMVTGNRAMGLKCTILVADRNRHVREFLRRELESEGYRVKMARDGREVWEALSGGDPPHLLILDLEIPYMEELGDKIRKHHPVPHVPLIVHSFQEESAAETWLTHAAAFLEKKEDPAHLKEVVAEVLDRHYRHRFQPPPPTP